MFTRLGMIQLSDFWRGFIIAVITTPLTIVYDSVLVGVLTFDWKKIVLVAIAGGVAYLLKNLATGEEDKLLTNK